MVVPGRNKGILWTDPHTVMRIFGVVVGCFAFWACYMVLITSISATAASICAVFAGVAVVAVYLLFANRKHAKLIILGAVALYTVLCVAIGFNQFVNGAGSFINGIVSASNERMHWGFASVMNVTASQGADFVFCSVFAAWWGLASAAVIHRSAFWHLVPIFALTALWLSLGLVPNNYSIVLLIFSLVLLLICDNGLTMKAAMCYIIAAVVVFGAVSPALLYNGSNGVKAFKNGIDSGVQRTLYGTDDLPQGKLVQSAGGMRISRDVRLKVTLGGDVRNLYLRGFVGSTLQGNAWEPTDKNAYVSGEYQGLLDYVNEQDIPFMQYARYSEITAPSNAYDVIVENVSANKKYLYAPYTLSSISSSSRNGDMNLKAGAIPKTKYSYKVFAGDKSNESVSQAPWLTGGALQTAQMREYTEYEAQYRNFVHNTYGVIDSATARSITAAMNITDLNDSINPATNVIRNYFSTNYTYSDKADPIGKNFASDFFGGKIQNANAAYFASAAVLIYRAYNYPARYVEGYLVYADEGQTRVDVTGNYSHAWVEVYFDGIGWLPIEITPGFYKDAPALDPDDPEPPEEEPEPIKPPEQPDDPPVVTPAPPEEVIELTPEERNFVGAIKVAIFVAIVLLVCGLVVLGFMIHYTVVMHRKRVSLKAKGEAFGRAAYSIAERDCKIIGGFSADSMQAVGIDAALSKRFMQILERCVYGNYELTVNERRFVLRYLTDVTDAIANNGDKWYKFICRYIVCVGI